MPEIGRLRVVGEEGRAGTDGAGKRPRSQRRRKHAPDYVSPPPLPGAGRPAAE